MALFNEISKSYATYAPLRLENLELVLEELAPAPKSRDLVIHTGPAGIQQIHDAISAHAELHLREIHIRERREEAYRQLKFHLFYESITPDEEVSLRNMIKSDSIEDIEFAIILMESKK